MSYQQIEVKIENTTRQATNAKPLYVNLGALSPNDMTTLKVTTIVESISALGSAVISLQESIDLGATWRTLTTETDGPIDSTGAFSVWVTGATGIPSPNLRLKVLPAAGTTLFLEKVLRTFTTGDNLIPIASMTSSGGATEATQQKLRRWPYADWDTKVHTWTPGIFTDAWEYKLGGPSGTSVGLKTIVYTDATRANINYIRHSPTRTE